MPTHDRFGLDNRDQVENSRPMTIKPDEQRAVYPTQRRSARRSLLQDTELMPQDQDIGFQRCSRLAQHTDQQEVDCNHATIML
jgi:hypothetical protein